MNAKNANQTGLNFKGYSNQDISSSYYYEMNEPRNTTAGSGYVNLSTGFSGKGNLLAAKNNRRCPICNGGSSCSFRADYSIINCHRSDSPEVNVNGTTYRFAHFANKGSDTTWAVYYAAKEIKVNFDQAVATGYEKPVEIIKKATGSTLPPEVRNASYRAIASKFTKLYNVYNTQLLGKRELRQSEIDYLVSLNILFNWDNDMSISELKLPLDLPGVNTNLNGSKLVGSEGMFVSAMDLKGNIVGGQIASRDRSKGKYKAVSSNNFGGKSWHIDNEWPLAYWDFKQQLDIYNNVSNRTDLENTLFICEGFLKPLVLGVKLNRHNHNYRVIGASGGQFYHSHRQLKAIVNQGYSRVVLCADKGSVNNKAVIDNYIKLEKTLKNWGIKLEVLHFSHADCDELQEFEYLNLSSNFVKWSQFENKFNKDCLPNPELQQSILNRRKAQYLGQKSLNKKIDHLLDTEYLDLPMIQEGDMWLVKSPLGTGKTTQLDKILKQYPYGWLLIGYRNNLLIETCNDRTRAGVPFHHLHEDAMYSQMADPSANIAFCVDSLPQWSISRLESRPLIIDECKSVMHHILMSSTRVKDDRISNLDKLKEAIRMSPMVILMDATADEATLNFYQELAGGRKVVVFENKATTKDRFTVAVTTGLNEKGESSTDKSHLIKQIIASEGNIVVFSDSRRECEAINQLELDRNRRTLLITSETVVEDDVKKALKNLNQYILDNQIQTLIYSPSGESGINIDIDDYFTVAYGIFYGVISIDSCMQMLGRVRDTIVPRIITIPNKGMGEVESIFSLEIHNKVISNMITDAAYTYQDSELKDAIQSIIQGSIGESLHWSYKYIAAIRADLALEKQFFKELFMQRLEQLGMHIHVAMDSIDREIKLMVKEQKEEAKITEATAIFNAEDIDEDEFKTLSAKYSLNLKQQRQLKKHQLKTRLPGIQQTDLWNVDLIKDLLIDNPNKIGQLERMLEIDLPHISIAKGRDRWNRYLSKDHLSITDVKTDTAIVKTLISLGIPDLLEPTNLFVHGDKRLLKLKEKCSDKAIERILGLKTGKQSEIRFFGQLIKKFFGLSLICFRPVKEDKQIYQYMIGHYEDDYLITMFDCIMRRNTKIMERVADAPEPLAVQRLQSNQNDSYEKSGTLDN